ncbi:MAG: WD40 repeat protein [Rhodothermales bacterium]|jgi:WD40 repeat protein
MALAGTAHRIDPVFILGSREANSTKNEPASLPVILGFSPKGNGVVVVRKDHRVIEHDLTSREETVLTHSRPILARSPDGKLAIALAPGGIGILDPYARAESALTVGGYEHASFSANNRLAVASDREVQIWDLDNRLLLATLQTRLPVRNGLALAPNGETLVIAEGNYRVGMGRTTLLEVWAGQVRLSALREDAINMGVWGIAFSGNSEVYGTTTQEYNRSGVRIWRTRGNFLIFEKKGFEAYWTRALAISENGSCAATGDESGNLVLWDIGSGLAVHRSNLGQVVQSVAFSKDGRFLLAGLWDSTVRGFEIQYRE